MLTTFKNATATVRRAIVLSVLAWLSITLPIVWTVVLKFYGQGLGLFWVLYLLFAIPATVASITASRRGEWRNPESGKRLLFALYGLPVVIVVLVAAWAVKR